MVKRNWISASSKIGYLPLNARRSRAGVMSRFTGHDRPPFRDAVLQCRHAGRGLQAVNDNRPRLTRSAINKALYIELVVLGTLLRHSRLIADGNHLNERQ